MQPVLQRRDLDIKMNSKKFKTYETCPLCRGCFHSAKACIFRNHAPYFNELRQQIQQLTQDLTGSQDSQEKEPMQVLLHKTTLQKEQEKEATCDEDTDDEEPVFTFDKIFKALLDYQQIQNLTSKNCSRSKLSS